MIFKFFRESVRQPGESAHLHPHRGRKTRKRTEGTSTQQLLRRKERDKSPDGIRGPIASTVWIARLHQDRSYRPAVRTANLKHRRIRRYPGNSVSIYRKFNGAFTSDAFLLFVRFVIHGFLPQRAFAAFAAIWERLRGPSFAALAARRLSAHRAVPRRQQRGSSSSLRAARSWQLRRWIRERPDAQGRSGRVDVLLSGQAWLTSDYGATVCAVKGEAFEADPLPAVTSAPNSGVFSEAVAAKPACRGYMRRKCEATRHTCGRGLCSY
jgi:hypothetical protein